MSNPEITNLTSVLQELVEMTSGDLVRDRQLGEFLNFRAGETDFRRVRTLATRLLAADLEVLGDGQISQLTSYGVTLRDFLKNIASFSTEGSNPAGQRDSLLSSVRSTYESFANAAATALSIASRTEIDLADIRSRAESAMAELRQIVTEARAAQERASEEARQVVAGLQAASGTGGVARHTTLFGAEANAHHGAANKWLIAVVVLTVLTLGYAAWTLAAAPSLPREATVADGVQYAVGKVLVFTVLLSAVPGFHARAL